VATCVTPTSGSLTIDGQDTGTLDENGPTALRGRSISFVVQYHHLIPAFSAVEDVMMPLLMRRGYADKDMRRTAERLLD
jgi:lipoprotein-releasing system ATP-binding protein